ncbi:H-NS histone family protein [Piscinibacter sp. Jin2]|uniref:H-NS histone family protein n=1 Tax=Aquariibacter lacus TaxID=2801332 RepID=A0A9X0XGY9_9BURK|nr:H-NS histone family protein [Piscinibacter lacus]MBL0719345.1 H-NS histone family protein [Piscinibacter lacus]
MAESSLTPEQRVVVHRIRALMAFWQITPEELAGADIGPAPAPPPPPPSAPKYRHPRSGETWDGQGSQPDWLKQALLREGFLVEELRIEAGESFVDAPAAPEAGAESADPAESRETSAR